MAIMDLLRNVSGSSGYGSAFGRSVFENGLTFGKTLYLGHGIKKSTSGAYAKFFKDSDEMLSSNFELFSSGQKNIQSVDLHDTLAIHCCVASMTIATRIAMFCARYFNRQENKNDFNRAMGASTAEMIRQSNSGITVELFQSFMSFPVPTGIKFVNLDIPGEDDLIGLYLNEAVKRSMTFPIGFQRSGPFGFGTFANSLWSDTVNGFDDAIAKFHW